jgi:hypothetical protein
MYTALVLDENSVNLLKHYNIPQGWSVKCHHMTCNMGKADNGPAAMFLGQEHDLVVTHIAQDEYVIAVAVETQVPSGNKQKHITLAVNERAGGKAKMSNDLKNWIETERLTLHGKVMEVS